ncbi:hypothetical protein CBS63078_4523 [Aspergillus niger]|nr:hypothetical protein CBS115989_7331 [Aspergillus niger]KAI2831064.1 hypothetical protein CBS133816_2900 [Aspergillus niger]KAI2840804.1 hypothetical protein CBS11350_6823 [Aspergillus niger]KAI2857958.1 hypothetical protein CBS11232_2970 [Aspergillus niger]KAI2859602.1 hypothetical protein CBS12448_5617 [Aspergillus niger]
MDGPFVARFMNAHLFLCCLSLEYYFPLPYPGFFLLLPTSFPYLPFPLNQNPSSSQLTFFRLSNRFGPWSDPR